MIIGGIFLAMRVVVYLYIMGFKKNGVLGDVGNYTESEVWCLSL